MPWLASFISFALCLAVLLYSLRGDLWLGNGVVEGSVGKSNQIFVAFPCLYSMGSLIVIVMGLEK